MTPLRSWVDAARPAHALVVPLCAAVGSSYAHFDAQRGAGFLVHALLTLGAFAAGVGVNLVDLAWDRLGQPPPEEPPAGERFSPLDPTTVGATGLAAIAIATLCGFGLVPLCGSGPLAYGALAVVLGALRTAPLVGPSAVGWPIGEILALVAVGPLAAMAGYASQAGGATFGALLAGVPAGLVAAGGLLVRHAPRRGLDASAERGIAVALPLLGAAAVAVAVRAGEYGPWALAAVLPLVAHAVSAWRAPAGGTGVGAQRADRLALGCAFAALACIVVALQIAARA